MARYLNWLQHDTKIFNVGERRRVAAGGPTKPSMSARSQHSRFPDLNHLSAFTTTSLDQMLSQAPPVDSPSPAAQVLVNGELPLDDLGSTDLPPPALDPEMGTHVPNGDHAIPTSNGDLPMEARDDVAQEQIDQSAHFFDPDNTEAADLREQLAMETLDELLDFLLDQNGSVGIFDATNSTLNRRKNIMTKIRQRAGPELGVLFLESQCIDETVRQILPHSKCRSLMLLQLLESNMRLKLSGPDYKDRDPVKALADFKQRVALYEKRYVPLGEDEEKNNVSYVQVSYGRENI